MGGIVGCIDDKYRGKMADSIIHCFLTISVAKIVDLDRKIVMQAKSNQEMNRVTASGKPAEIQISFPYSTHSQPPIERTFPRRHCVNNPSNELSHERLL